MHMLHVHKCTQGKQDSMLKTKNNKQNEFYKNCKPQGQVIVPEKWA